MDLYILEIMGERNVEFYTDVEKAENRMTQVAINGGVTRLSRHNLDFSNTGFAVVVYTPHKSTKVKCILATLEAALEKMREEATNHNKYTYDKPLCSKGEREFSNNEFSIFTTLVTPIKS